MPTISHTGKPAQLLIYIRSSLWFVPALLLLASIVLAQGLIQVDRHIGEQLKAWWPQMFAMEAEGARTMLSAIATSMATVAGVVFSITMVVLTLASSQYSSRVLRNFMRDPLTQRVLGVFVGVYIYCLFVLRSMAGNNGDFIPSLAILGGFVLAVIASGFFIFFIHHVSSSIQAPEIIGGIAQETIKAIDSVFPEEAPSLKKPHRISCLDLDKEKTWHPIPATSTGYIQTMNSDGLLKVAMEQDTIVRMEAATGDFVGCGRPLAWLAIDAPPDKQTIGLINQIYAIDGYRTTDQDPAFGIRQLVDIAMKALSPSMNDTTTAVTSIEHLSVILAHCASRHIETPNRYDDQGKLRVIARGPSFESLVAVSFRQILENAASNTEVLLRLLNIVRQVAEVAIKQEYRDVLILQVHEIIDTARRGVVSPYARHRIEQQLKITAAALDMREQLTLLA
jgi:uncharacterized membrane protein